MDNELDNGGDKTDSIVGKGGGTGVLPGTTRVRVMYSCVYDSKKKKKKRIVNYIIWCHETYDWGNLVSRDENILKTTMRRLSVTKSTSKTCNM